MKKIRKKKIIITIYILILLFALLFSIINKDNRSILERISETKVIIVNKLGDESFPQDKKISNMDEVNDVIKIIQNAQKMSEDQIINYRGIPHYKLKMEDKKNSLITTINLFCNDNLSYISFENDDTNYIVDANLLLEIIDNNKM